MKYIVTIEEIITDKVEVDANSEKEALKIAHEYFGYDKDNVFSDMYDIVTFKAIEL